MQLITQKEHEMVSLLTTSWSVISRTQEGPFLYCFFASNRGKLAQFEFDFPAQISFNVIVSESQTDYYTPDQD